MSKTIWIILVVTLLLGIGIRSYLKEQVPDSRLLSQYLEGKETANENRAVTPTPAPVSTGRAPNTEAKSLNEEDRKKMAILKEIFSTHNDNDPRMDTELLKLSPELKQAMVEFYRADPPEKLNERGTIVFLLGRNISSKEDVDFIQGVMMEKPCMSLADCSKVATGGSDEESHLEAINETTASYPQLNGLKALIADYKKNANEANGDRELAEREWNALREATRSANPRIAQDASNALSDLKKE